jgi:hypothetical protein
MIVLIHCKAKRRRQMRNQVTRLSGLCSAIIVVFTCIASYGANPTITVEASSIDALLKDLGVISQSLEMEMPEPALEGMISHAINAPGLVGIDRSKPAQVRVFMPEVNASLPTQASMIPAVVFVLPLSGDGTLFSGALKEGFLHSAKEGALQHLSASPNPHGRDIYMSIIKGYAVLGNDSDSVGAVLKTVKAKGIHAKSLLTVPGTIRVGFATKKLVTFIETASQTSIKAMQQQKLPPEMTMNPAKVLKAEVDALLALMRQLDGLALSIRVRDKTIELFSQTDPVPGTTMAAVIKSLKTPSERYMSFPPKDALFATSGSGLNVFDTIAEPYAKLIGEIYDAMGPPMNAISPAMLDMMTNIKGLYAGDFALAVVAEDQGKIGFAEVVALNDAVKAKAIMDEIMASYNDTWAPAMPGLKMEKGEPRVHDGVTIESYSYTVDTTAAKQSPMPNPMLTWLTKMSYELAYVDNDLLYTLGTPELMNASIDRIKKPADGSRHSQYARLIPKTKVQPIQISGGSLSKIMKALLSLSPNVTDQMLSALPSGSGTAGIVWVKDDNYFEMDCISIDEIIAIKAMVPIIMQVVTPFAMQQAGGETPRGGPTAPTP